MENVDVSKRCDALQKDTKLGLCLVVSFFVLDAISIALFIIYANWKEQVMLSVIGSIISSLFGIIALFFFFSSYQPSKESLRLYRDLARMEKSESKETVIFISPKRQTQQKGIHCYFIQTKEHEYYLLPEETPSFEIGKEYTFSLCGKYIVGASKHEN